MKALKVWKQLPGSCPFPLICSGKPIRTIKSNLRQAHLLQGTDGGGGGGGRGGGAVGLVVGTVMMVVMVVVVRGGGGGAAAAAVGRMVAVRE